MSRDEQETLLSDRIYPPTAYDEATRRDQDLALRDTRFAQPAIGAVSLGLLRILEDFGVRPDLTGGHSFGELTALCAAGRIDDRSLALLAERRGAIMASCAEDGGDGAMLAVFAPLEQVAALLREHGLDVVIANKNAPRQCVLSGPAGEIERSQRLLEDRGVTTRPVPVSAAFHSRAVASAARASQRGPRLDRPGRLGDSRLRQRDGPALSRRSRGRPAPCSRASSPGRSSLSPRSRRCIAAGARTFLEVGPDAKLTGLVHAILEGRDHLALAVDAARGSHGNLHDLACSLATLASVGYAVDLTRWDDREPRAGAAVKKAGLTVKICGANARPKATPDDQPPMERSRHGPREDSDNTQASPPSPRFSIAREYSATCLRITGGRSHRDRSDHEPARTDQLASLERPGFLARASPATAARRAGSRDRAGRSPDVVPTQAAALSLALQNAQDNLLALQRLAEQTAALHRQFLEGQEKTQQIFLKLLDQEQRLSLALLDSAEQPASRRRTPPALRLQEHLASSDRIRLR